MSRRPGTGTVEILPSGLARYRLTLASGKRITSRAYADEAEATRKLDAARALLCSGQIIEATTIGAWGARWLEMRHTVNASRERGLWRHHVEGTPLAELPVEEVRLRHLRTWAEGLQRHKVLVQVAGGKREEGEAAISTKTRRLCVGLVRRVLAAAVEEELIQVNPAASLRIEWPDADLDDEWTFLTEPEIAQLLGHEVVPVEARLHYQWAIGSGARQSESWALRWEDVDLDGGRCTIRRSGERQRTKGGRVRRFAILPLGLDALRQWREICPSTAPTALVWPAAKRKGDPAGGRQRAEDDMGWADRSRGAQGVTQGHRTIAGIQRPVTYHDLRHTACAGLLRGYPILGVGRAWSLDEVCDWIGHSSRQVTEIYAHITGGGLADRAISESTASPRLLLAVPPSATAPATGLEPVTRWLTDTSTINDSNELAAKRDPPWTTATAERAADLLRAAASKDPHIVRRAIELAAAVLDEAAAAQAPEAVPAPRRLSLI